MIDTVETLLCTLPLPFTTTQVCAGFDGCVLIVTAYAEPLVSGVGNVKFTLFRPVTVTVSVPLFSNTNPLPANPETFPPTVNTGAHVTCTPDTFAAALPEPLVTLQF